jgi:hypothetical protein
MTTFATLASPGKTSDNSATNEFTIILSNFLSQDEDLCRVSAPIALAIHLSQGVQDRATRLFLLSPDGPGWELSDLS